MATKSKDSRLQSHEAPQTSEAAQTPEAPGTSEGHRVSNAPREDDTPNRESPSEDSGKSPNSMARLRSLGSWADDLIQEIRNLKQENASLKAQHEDKAEKLYETYCGQLKKMYDVDVRFERGQRILAQELAAQARQSPDIAHLLCNTRQKMLEKARDDAYVRHDQAAKEKRELQERLASLEFEKATLHTKLQEETAEKNKLLEALTQSNERARDLTDRLCKTQSSKDSMREDGGKVDAPEDADGNSGRVILQKRLMEEIKTVRSQLLGETEKTKNLRDELKKEQQCNKEAQRLIHLEANDLEYSKMKIAKHHDAVSEVKKEFTKVLEDLSTRNSAIAHKDKQLEDMYGELAHKNKQLAAMQAQVAKWGHFNIFENEPVEKPAKQVASETVVEPDVASNSTVCSSAVSRAEKSTSADRTAEAPSQVPTLTSRIQRLEAASEKELKLLRKLVSDNKVHKALETQVAAQKAENAEQARLLAAKEAEVLRLRNRLEDQSWMDCEKHNAELLGLQRRLDKLKGLSLELADHIDVGSDALKKCGDAMKEQLRRI